jgi:hypothetical protein
MDETVKIVDHSADTEQTNLSYKFQRLRERLRQAIASGELAGKLPGERALAKRFQVNAKTLSKALTDLAAEGLLDRSIGRGTFVKGSAPVSGAGKRWLVLCDAEQVGWEIVKLLRESHSELEVATDVSACRPSFLNQFSAVIDLAQNTPDAFLRDLVVRNVPVVVVGKEPKTYSTHSVVFDVPYAVAQLGRELFLSGHRKLAAVEPRQSSVVAGTLRHTAARYGQVAVEACLPHEVTTLVENGVTAFVCKSVELAAQAKKQLEAIGVAIPEQVSIAAIGASPTEPPVSGYFIPRGEKVNAIVQLLTDQNTRPVTMWLAGKFFDHRTIAPVTEATRRDMLGDDVMGDQSSAAYSPAAG